MLFLHISLKSQNQQSEANKKINQLNVAMWKKITSKSLKKIKHLFIPLQYNLAFQIAFFHLSIYDKRSYICTIQNAILSI
jgi:hypothetical protein